MIANCYNRQLGVAYEGTVVLNYKLTQLLGEGGFGAVYLAEHQTLGRKAACKILHPQYARHPELVERFFREAKAVCAIGHRAIIDIENFGKLPGGEQFYLMEYFPGEALADRIRRQPLTIEEIPVVFHPVVSALAAAHGLHIVHRDLKPDNVMLLEDMGQIVDVKLLDFGIAKLVDSQDTVKSRTGATMGTPTYMAPEQGRDSKNVDERADVYGFGATLFAALAGRPPFVADNVTEIIVAVQTKPAPPLREFVPHAPAALEAVLARCLEKDPASRPPTIIDAWNEVLEAIGAPLPAVAPGSSVAFVPHARLGTNPPVRASAAQPIAPTIASDPGLDSQPPRVSSPMAATLAPEDVSAMMPGGAPPSTTLSGATGAVTSASPPQKSRAGLFAVLAVVLLGGGAGAYAAFGGGGSGSDGAKPSAAPVATAPDPIEVDPTEVPPPDLTDAAPVGVADAAVPVVAQVPVVETVPEPDKKPPKPNKECQKRSFERFKGKKLTASRREAVLRRAERCQRSGELSARYVAELTKALTPPPPKPDPPKPDPPKPDPPKPDPPKDDCSPESFARVYRARKPSEDSVRSALKRLRTCKGKLGNTRYTQIQTALVKKL